MPTDRERLARLEQQMQDTVIPDLTTAREDIDAIKHQRSWLLGGVAGVMLVCTVATAVVNSRVVTTMEQNEAIQRALAIKLGVVTKP